MKSLNIESALQYVKDNIGSFHRRRLENLERLQLDKILKRKNPYLFKAKNILTAQDFVKSILDAHLSSQEEAIFGDFLEGLAIHIAGSVFDGQKSSAEGIDLEFRKDGVRYILAIKSGPNWGNSSQIRRMVDNFKKAKKILRTSDSKIYIRAVNGCCYGRDKNPDKGEYLKLCGQDFWSFISNVDTLYTEIIKPIGFEAKAEK